MCKTICIIILPIDKGPIKTSVIVAPPTSPKQQEIIEIVDTQDTPVASSASLLHPSQTAPSLVSRSPSMTVRQSGQPLRAGDLEQQSNPTVKNSEQVIQLDKHSWEQLPPLYKYMIQMRVIEEQQQMQMAAQHMQGQQPQRQQPTAKPTLPAVSTQLQPNFLQNLALQTQMFNMFQAQLANPNLLPQIAGKLPLVATPATGLPLVSTAGVIPNFPANFMVTTTTNSSTASQQATVAMSSSMEPSNSSTSHASTSIISNNSKLHDNKKHQKYDKVNDMTNYRTSQPIDSPEEPPSDENSGKIPGMVITICFLHLSLAS